MKTVISLAGTLFFTVFVSVTAGIAAEQKPNILIVAVDDMGFSDLGSYGGEIATPNLDSLASNGIRFTQFYNTARCWPTRSALMSGYYPQQIRMDPMPQNVKLPNWTALLPQHLKPLGYRSYHSGKWHVMGRPRPVADGGFDHSYTLHDHDRNFYPTNHWVDDEPIPAVEPGSDYYTTCAITDYTLGYLDDHEKNHADEPFLMYTAYTVPHFPLHALPEDIAKYKDKYKIGWDEIRKQRYQNLLDSGIVNCSLSEREDDCGIPYPNRALADQLGPGELFFPKEWDTLTEQQKDFQATKMAIHAAMVDRMDQEVGRIVEKLREMNALDNTIIFFFSDNGASAEILVRGDGHDKTAEPGSGKSFLSLGPGWSTASNTPFRRHKIWNQEGGISTPFIVHWPNGIKNSGSFRNDVGHVVDIVPTILEIVGAERAETFGGEPVPEFPGVS
ncbi:MAG: sulfatase-like hydrolase/transferase, partial [Thermoguttaceae bacterium]